MSYIDSKYAFRRAQEFHDPIADPEFDGWHDPFHAKNSKLSREIWSVVQFHYPGHPWHVGVNHKQGMAQIGLPTFSSWTFNIRLLDLMMDTKMSLVIKGAGEFLERYKIPRAGFDVANYVMAQKKYLPMLNINRRPPD